MSDATDGTAPTDPRAHHAVFEAPGGENDLAAAVELIDEQDQPSSYSDGASGGTHQSRAYNMFANIKSKGTELASKASELTSNAAASAKEGAAQLDDKVTGGKLSATTAAAVTTVSSTATTAAAAIDDRTGASAAASAAAKSAMSTANQGKEMVKDAAAEQVEKQRENARVFLIQQAEKYIDRSIPWLSRKMKAKIYDPDMPKAMDRAAQGVVDEFMPEVKTIMMDAFVDKLRKKDKDLETALMSADPLPCCQPNCGIFDPILCFRAKVLYTLFPFDKSVWGKIKNPWFWVLTLIAAAPVYGVAQVWGILLLAMKDRQDEYQLVNFIVTFKSSMFVAVGVLPTLIGVGLYINCASAGNDSTCDVDGPGLHQLQNYQMFVFLLQLVIAWMAAALLPYSEKKGGRLYEQTTYRRDHILATFEKFDLSKDGQLDRSETKAILRKLKLEMEPAEFDSWFAAHDKDGSGSLDQDEFITAVIKLGADLDAALNKRGGRLWYFIWYDIIIVALLIIFAAAVYATTSSAEQYSGDREWISKTRTYWLRALYGWLCLPWLLLKMPLAGSFLLHVKPTAYNPQGKTVPFRIPKHQRPEDEKEEKPEEAEPDEDGALLRAVEEGKA
eukprot:CAMPEP_0119542920 /NCGR_PEP_ID=MMETSP1344-20130328/53848_1 /TAXON_ID=236787 /ORGANISM="Florenciella parvula, Strain CCMP2471" /LENGTH=614 /DNA_ID=CAMNT_0007587185 /DNA_START=12 /DNA_END=1856 /DNA_ORIENTATION=-